MKKEKKVECCESTSTAKRSERSIVYIGRNAVLYEVHPNEEFDSKTRHLIREIDGEPVEMKYCIHCKQWRPLSDYYKDNAKMDGLGSWCKNCNQQRSRNQEEAKASVNEYRDIADIGMDYSTVIKWLAINNDKTMALMKKQSEKIEDLEATIRSMKDNREDTDVTGKYSDDIMEILTSDEVSPQMLFTALQAKDTTRRYYYKDLLTGNICPVCTDPS